MEFPDTGERCSLRECRQLDFLPFNCDHCRRIFCKEHFHASSHSCPVLEKLESSSEIQKCDSAVSNYECSAEKCESTSVVRMPCVKCGRHFCLAHRYHGCLEKSEEERLRDLKKWQKPRQDFSIAKENAEKEVARSLKKSKNLSMANKVQLMKLKGKAIGSSGLPESERRYFLVHPPRGSEKQPKAIYVSVRWSVGKVIDFLADALDVPNANNVSTAEKLRLFRHQDGKAVCRKMDTELTELFDEGVLENGQSVILEYREGADVDPSLYS